MIHTLPRFALRPKQRTPYCLMSDLHIGAADTDERRIKSELDWARANKARVFIAGDVFDAIFLGDPRHTTSVLAKKFRNTDAPLNAVLDHAVDMLRPYADLIDLIGVGNHETKVLAKSGYDMVDLLIERLTAGTKHKIFHGGYMGVIRVPLYYKNASSRHASQYTISYHHGWSGAPGQSKGVLDFNKVRIEGADCIWFGHRHSRTATPEATWYIPQRGDTPLLRHVLNIRTGAYKQASWHQNEGGQHQTKWTRENGMDLMPESMGGARLWLELNQGRVQATLEMFIA